MSSTVPLAAPGAARTERREGGHRRESRPPRSSPLRYVSSSAPSTSTADRWAPGGRAGPPGTGSGPGRAAALGPLPLQTPQRRPVRPLGPRERVRVVEGVTDLVQRVHDVLGRLPPVPPSAPRATASHGAPSRPAPRATAPRGPSSRTAKERTPAKRTICSRRSPPARRAARLLPRLRLIRSRPLTGANAVHILVAATMYGLPFIGALRTPAPVTAGAGIRGSASAAGHLSRSYMAPHGATWCHSVPFPALGGA